jgi:hypothetical protein
VDALDDHVELPHPIFDRFTFIVPRATSNPDWKWSLLLAACGLVIAALTTALQQHPIRPCCDAEQAPAI